MPKTRAQQEFTTVRGTTGLGFDCPTASDCERHIQRLTDLIHAPGQAEQCQIDIWRADRDLVLDRLAWHLMVAERPADEAQA